jgi:predicted TIM-barrel fold metal-dependent hydrolase
VSSPAASQIFDIHQHVGGLIGIAGVGDSGAGPQADATRRLAVMDRFGIAQAALMPAHAYANPRGLADTRAVNDAIAAVARLAADRFPVMVGTVEPRHGSKALDEVDRLHGAGFRAISWHHRMQGLPMDHPAMFAIVERMSRLGMPVLAHCYASADFEAPWRLRRLAERFPQTGFVALDAMTSPENLEQILGATEMLANVHLDLTSTVLGSAGVRATVSRAGAARLLFGSNLYSMADRGHLGELECVREAGLTESDRRLILGGNARRLMGL